MVALIGSLVAFVVALLVGGLAIYVGASLIVGLEDYSHAVVTAIVGALAWALTAWIPLFGPLLALIAWIWVVNWRYPGGWLDAALIGVVAWLAALAILFVLDTILGLGVGAFGVPGA
ncbi:uncharacterized protein Nmag_1404 [Natrialba magadii ATCC 43099]|uniref:Uncharacterized protein n=1 Tax=Natrialba magadii (strain ATCC 43099 / DSM 3394 / CCM 3739 / CIP 104546 / IAM 13178 / JCM 8861 / NBRC 102185 / NCIMB 2190 / MS3) TaxID=547559 RepID=D3ST37_NATMM|nr:hypothetical protein [Natrialba magadii]ADD04983.1 uncharacterized protein Nmag_1404 [Natrialba magadii ATCC 43099]ELY24029.1 hypothetical protein C500_19535 [Natrialba magadii ATCC 43099]